MFRIVLGFAAWVIIAGIATDSRAETVNVLIGDKDGFNGRNPWTAVGQNYNPNIGLPTIAPGTHTNATDVHTTGPDWQPYIFIFEFDFDVSSFSAISSAVVDIFHGSLSRRSSFNSESSGPGYGFADVSASFGGSSTSLGEFLTTDTGATGSGIEESVKVSSFDVLSLISAGTSGTLALTIDYPEGVLANPVDLFAIDYAELTVEGTPVPLPATAWLFLAGLGLVGAASWRRKGFSLPAA